MFETILAAVDGSSDGDLVAEKAGRLAALCNARLLITYIANPGVANDDLEMLATTEHLEAPPAAGPHTGVTGVPGWFDDALSNAEGAASLRQVLDTLGSQVLERAAFIAKKGGANDIVRMLEAGDPASRIVDIARSENADLIVIGSRGLGRIKDLLLGSVSHKVTMTAPCPCLIMK